METNTFLHDLWGIYTQVCKMRAEKHEVRVIYIFAEKNCTILFRMMGH